MALITNNKESLHNGVNQQPNEMRLDTQVSEMVNCLPTLDVGLRKRNPSTVLELSESIAYEDEMWQHSYDKGLAGTDEEKYSIIIGKDTGLSIVNINTGKVYTQANGGIVFAGNAAEYISPFVDANGYAAVTVKDTTFIVNKNVQPSMRPGILGGDNAQESKTYHYVDFNFVYNPTPSLTYYDNIPIPVRDPYLTEDMVAGLAPYTFEHLEAASYDENYFELSNTGSIKTTYYGANANFYIDGIAHTQSTSTSRKEDPGGLRVEEGRFVSGTYFKEPTAITMREFIADAIHSLSTKLGSNYKVESPSNGKIRVTRLDTQPFIVTPTLSIVFPTLAQNIITSPYYLNSIGNPPQSTYLNSVVVSSLNSDGTIIVDALKYKKIGFVWIKASEPVSGYSYTARIRIDGGTEKTFTVSGHTTTEAAANALASSINADATLGAYSVGSVVKISLTGGTQIDYVSTSDSFGNQASIGFAHTVATMNDLPKNLGFPDTLIKIEGTESSDAQAYWVRYDGSLWVEAIEPLIETEIDATTMPHILTRDDPAYPNKTDFFSFKAYDGWEERKIGDNNSNPKPSFIFEEGRYYSPIKDIFFFKNRLGFITETTVALSEVGEYGNFFRTTALAVLDSDAIDTAVDSTEAVRLEYAMYLEDSVMLFSDKAQFKLAGGRILSPKSVQVSKTSAYEMNKKVRPIFLNNSIFFVANRGEYSAIMEYVVNVNSEVSEAIDITAHVQSYIPDNVVQLSGSSIDNMLFIRSTKTDDTLYVYKYYDKGDQRVQSAWFKWVMNGRVKSAFSLGPSLNLMIMRRTPESAENWILADGTWNMSNVWDMDAVWVMSIDSIPETGSFEKIASTPQDVLNPFLDAIVDGVGTLYNSEIDFGIWVLDMKAKGIKTKRGHLQFKTVEISSEPGSDFYLEITDTRNDKSRIVPSKYTVGKKPLVMGNAEKMNLEIKNWTESGFQINSVSYEGNYVSRNQPI